MTTARTADHGILLDIPLDVPLEDIVEIMDMMHDLGITCVAWWQLTMEEPAWRAPRQ